MSQDDFGNIDPYVVDGVALASLLNNWRDTLYTMHRGAARPSYVVPGQVWVSDAAGAANWAVNYYVSPTVGDVELFSVNTTTGAVTWRAGLIGGPFLPLSGGTVTGEVVVQADLVAFTTWSQNYGGAIHWYDVLDNPTGSKLWQSGMTGGDGKLHFRATSDDTATVQGDVVMNRDGSMVVTSPATAALAGEVATASWVRALVANPQLFNLQQFTETVTTPAIVSGTLTINLAAGSVFKIANNANLTAFNITNATPGKALSFTLILSANGTAYTQAWGSSVKWAFGIAPTLTSTGGKKDVLTFVSDDGGASWYGFVAGQAY